MPTIVIATGSHLCHNPRVIKEASALQDAGHEVEVLGGWLDPVLKARDREMMTGMKFRYRPLHDLTEQPALRLWLRVCGRLAKAIHAKTSCENHWQLGYFAYSLEQAVQGSKADLIIAHSEQALWAVARIHCSRARRQKSKARGRFGVDMEDWFSEDLPPEARKRRPVRLLRVLEQTGLRQAAHATCTSRAMSEALACEYGCRPPAVVYNAFPWAERAGMDGQFKDRANRGLPSIHWYSQTLGTDRGLEDLLAALPSVKREVEIHLRGKPVAGFENWLSARTSEGWRSRVFIHALVPNRELLSRIAEHDIGFAGERRISRNRDLTITNKILHYLLAGLAVVASDTAGQREVQEQAKEAVRLYPAGSPQALARELNVLLSSPEPLRTAKAAALAAAEHTFCWEICGRDLIASVTRALHHNGRA